MADADAADARIIGLLLQDALREGGCAAVICTTVSRAQQIFQTLQTYFPDPAATSLDLFHARFPYETRQDIEQRVLQRFGKDGPRPARAILVATQVIEQSLDLDFDVLITDLAPVDLVFQRLGRLHRHERPSESRPPRPIPFTTPTCYLFMPPQEDGHPVFTRAEGYIYAPHILLRSWQVLHQRTQLAIPGDIESLIETVYGEETAPPDMSPALQRFWEETYDHMVEDQAKEERAAKDRYIRDPGSQDRLDAIMRTVLEEDRPDIHPAHQALTRNSEPSVSVICLSGTRAQPFLRPGGDALDLNKVPDSATIRELMLRSVTISHGEIVKHLLPEPPPKHWQKIALLRHCRPVYFDAAGKMQIGSQVLHLDADLGIVIERKAVPETSVK